MTKILVLYYSSTGKTEKMARAVTDGAKSVQGIEVESYYVPEEELASYDAIVVGAPTYYHDMPETIKHYFEEVAIKNVSLLHKVAAAFRFYGWSVEAQKLILEILKNKFGMNVIEPPLLANYSPDQTALEKCFSLGKRVAESLIREAKNVHS
jgi:flavorubredoxin